MSSTAAIDDQVKFIRSVYEYLLARPVDDVGLNTFLASLLTGQMSRKAVISAIVQSDEFAQRHEVTPPKVEPEGCSREEAMEIFGRFPSASREPRANYITNFLGGITDIGVSSTLARSSGQVEGYPIPGNFHGETLEWVGTLRAVLEARDRFILIELGAGWGPWCVIGALAARQLGIPVVKVIGVEADAGHIEFMRRHFTDNGVAEDAEALHGAIGLESGTAYFPRARQAEDVYGGAASFSDHARDGGLLADFMTRNAEHVAGIEAVPALGLRDLLDRFDVVDLIHCDIQGGEEELLSGTIDLLTEKVRRIVVGTHSFSIERNLAGVMGRKGWICEGFSACKMTAGAKEPALVADGMQVWRNPRHDLARNTGHEMQVSRTGAGS